MKLTKSIKKRILNWVWDGENVFGGKMYFYGRYGEIESNWSREEIKDEIFRLKNFKELNEYLMISMRWDGLLSLEEILDLI